MEAWMAGVNQIRAAEDGKVEFLSVVKASEHYPPVTLVEKEAQPVAFPAEKVSEPFLAVLKSLQEERYQAQVASLKAKIKEDPSNLMLQIRLGMAHVEGGMISEGKTLFSSLADNADVEIQAAALNNLGNLFYLVGDFKAGKISTIWSLLLEHTFILISKYCWAERTP